jgi:hypothetical protein
MVCAEMGELETAREIISRVCPPINIMSYYRIFIIII